MKNAFAMFAMAFIMFYLGQTISNNKQQVKDEASTAAILRIADSYEKLFDKALDSGRSCKDRGRLDSALYFKGKLVGYADIGDSIKAQLLILRARLVTYQ